jgi:CubicO group peptidase (beta-lactamase class C family)
MSKFGSILFICLSMTFFSCSESGKKTSVKTIEKDTVVESLAYKPFDSDFIDSIQTFFEYDFSGTVLVYKKGQMYKNAFGYRDNQKKEKMDINDVFQLASVSKTVTATAVMLMHKKGKINIDSLVCKYMPDFPYKNVSIRHLLNHRSGLANYMYYTDTFWRDTSRCMNNKDLYKFMVQCQPKPYLMPDKSFSYCNTNYALLAVLVEKVSGLKFDQFVKKEIFDVAGMKHSYFIGCEPNNMKTRTVIGRYDDYVYTDKYYMDGILGDKSLCSNVTDLFLFHKALSDGKLVSQQQLQEMSEPSYKYNVYGGSYGLGFRLFNSPQGKWVYHNGWWRGFWTSFWNRFDEEICIVVLTNNKRSSHVDKKGLGEFVYQYPIR